MQRRAECNEQKNKLYQMYQNKVFMKKKVKLLMDGRVFCCAFEKGIHIYQCTVVADVLVVNNFKKEDSNKRYLAGR